MLEIKHILCPVDFSETSDRALEYGLGLAERLGAEITVLHVYQMPSYALAEGTLELPPYLADELKSGLKERLDALVQAKAGSAQKASSVLCEGIPYVEILREAKARGADLIVIGTHGRTGLAHMMIGSIAERVVRTAEVPVLTLRAP
jgi:nucleotide-binding universal stress UspA family protein